MTIERLIIVGNFSSQKNPNKQKKHKKQKFKTLLEHLAEIF